MNAKTINIGERGVVVLSGGMDSTTLLYHLLASGVQVVKAVGVNYNQRHAKELTCAAVLCRNLGVRFDVLDLSSVGRLLYGSSQTDMTVDVPHGHYAEENMKKTVVPNRNMLLLAAAGAIAVSMKADALFYGAHSGDHAIYPDCRPEFVEQMNAAFALADWHKVRVCAPFLSMSKGDICKLGFDLNVPFARTWTCYEGKETPCGKCGACVERAEAFAFAGVPDPLLR